MFQAMFSGLPHSGQHTVRDNKANRHYPLEVKLVRTGAHWRTLGLLVSPDDDPRYLIVDDIWEPSMISEWNAKQTEEKRVVAGDMITSVNGSDCSGKEMLAIIQSSGKR